MKKLILLLMIPCCALRVAAQTTQGGGLYLLDSKANSNVISGNFAVGEGTGAYAEGSSSLVNNTIAENLQGETRYREVGDALENGIVFYIDYQKRTALVVSMGEAPADKKYTYRTYGESGQDIAGASDLNDGKKNTHAIIAAQVIIPDIDSNRDNTLAANAGVFQNIKLPADTIRRAAHWCVELDDGGNSDWYLPSREELKKLYTAKEAVNTALLQVSDPNTLLGAGYYISSSQANAYEAWYVFFDNGETNCSAKGNVARVRAIREINF